MYISGTKSIGLPGCHQCINSFGVREAEMSKQLVTICIYIINIRGNYTMGIKCESVQTHSYSYSSEKVKKIVHLKNSAIYILPHFK